MLLRILLRVVVDEGFDPTLQQPVRPDRVQVGYHCVRVDSVLDIEIPDIAQPLDVLLRASSPASVKSAATSGPMPNR